MVEPVPRWPAEGFPSGKVMPVGSARHQVTLATVDWNRDQFCENSTMLFTVSGSGVILIEISQSSFDPI